MNKIPGRRDFLRSAALASSGAALYTSPLGVMSALAQQRGFDDYKALVCIFLFGGNDSFNTVVPRSAAEYAVYAESRQNLALANDVLLPITALSPDDAEYGLHPIFAEMQPLFDSGRMAILANVGNLIEPVTRDQFENGTVALPSQLFSHSDQQLQWKALQSPDDIARTGWAGRVADVLSGVDANSPLPMNLTLSGNNPWQVGSETIPYNLGGNGALNHTGLNPGSPRRERRRQAFEALLNKTHGHVFEQAYADVQLRALALSGEINAALSVLPPLATPFPDNGFGARLRTVARMIAARDDFSASRQIFFIGTGGFDTHDSQEEAQPLLLGGLSQALSAFYQATVELGVAQNVTTFTASEFGRTLTSNGDGTDHAWGGHQFIIGDAVLGQDIYGTMPGLVLDGPDDVGNGRIIPTTAVDQYAATLGRWFGLTDDELDSVLPNLVNFGSRDLGFMDV